MTNDVSLLNLKEKLDRMENIDPETISVILTNMCELHFVLEDFLSQSSSRKHYSEQTYSNFSKSCLVISRKVISSLNSMKLIINNPNVEMDNFFINNEDIIYLNCSVLLNNAINNVNKLRYLIDIYNNNGYLDYPIDYYNDNEILIANKNVYNNSDHHYHLLNHSNLFDEEYLNKITRLCTSNNPLVNNNALCFISTELFSLYSNSIVDIAYSQEDRSNRIEHIKEKIIPFVSEHLVETRQNNFNSFSEFETAVENYPNLIEQIISQYYNESETDVGAFNNALNSIKNELPVLLEKVIVFCNSNNIDIETSSRLFKIALNIQTIYLCILSIEKDDYPSGRHVIHTRQKMIHNQSRSFANLNSLISTLQFSLSIVSKGVLMM